MAFSIKTWVDRLSEHPTRRRLTAVSGETDVYDVTREEGTVTSEGDAFNAENMNDLESRINDALSDIDDVISALATIATTGSYNDLVDKPSSFTPSSHTHGNIQNGGTLQSNDITIANGDKLVVTDSSDSNKVARTSIAFDGSTTTQFLTKKGTWATPTGAGTQITQDTTFNISGTTFKITTA